MFIEIKRDSKRQKKNYKEVLSIRNIKCTKNHTHIADTCLSFAILYRLQSRFLESEEYLKRCLDIYQTNFGQNHTDVAKTFYHFAILYECQNIFEKAKEYYKKALFIYEEIFGKEHQVVELINNSIEKIK